MQHSAVLEDDPHHPHAWGRAGRHRDNVFKVVLAVGEEIKGDGQAVDLDFLNENVKVLDGQAFPDTAGGESRDPPGGGDGTTGAGSGGGGGSGATITAARTVAAATRTAGSRRVQRCLENRKVFLSMGARVRRLGGWRAWVVRKVMETGRVMGKSGQLRAIPSQN